MHPFTCKSIPIWIFPTTPTKPFLSKITNCSPCCWIQWSTLSPHRPWLLGSIWYSWCLTCSLTLSSLGFWNLAFRFSSYLWSLHLDLLCWMLFFSQPLNVGALKVSVLGPLLYLHSLLGDLIQLLTLISSVCPQLPHLYPQLRLFPWPPGLYTPQPAAPAAFSILMVIVIWRLFFFFLSYIPHPLHNNSNWLYLQILPKSDYFSPPRLLQPGPNQHCLTSG